MRALKSRRDQEEGGELDSQLSPGEIKSREEVMGSDLRKVARPFASSCSSTAVLRT